MADDGYNPNDIRSVINPAYSSSVEMLDPTVSMSKQSTAAANAEGDCSSVPDTASSIHRSPNSRGLSFNELARRKRLAARRDKFKKQGQTGASLTNAPKAKSEDANSGYQSKRDFSAGEIPRNNSQSERVFILTGSTTESTNTDNVCGESMPQPPAATTRTSLSTGSSLSNRNGSRKKLRWKEDGRNEPPVGDKRDVFTTQIENKNNQGLGESLSATQITHGGYYCGADEKSCDLTAKTCDKRLSDNKEAYAIGNENNHSHNGEMPLPTIIVPRNQSFTDGALGDNYSEVDSNGKMLQRNYIPKLQRQRAFNVETYSSSESEDEDSRSNAARNDTLETIYNVDMYIGADKHERDKTSKEDKTEDIYVPLWRTGNKISTNVQYKNDDTYVPIWTSNVPKSRRETRTSKSMDNVILEISDNNDNTERSDKTPHTPSKATSLDVARNKTTYVIQREKIPRNKQQMLRNKNDSDQDHTQCKASTSQQGMDITPDDIRLSHDNNVSNNGRNYNGHLKKLKLPYDLPQVHGEPKHSRDINQNAQHLEVPSLLERRGILLKEASSEDRAPALPVKHGRRSHGLPGGSQEAIAGPSTDYNEIVLQEEEHLSPFQKIKRHLSRSKSYSVDHIERASQVPFEPLPTIRHKNYFDLAIFTFCCCLSPLGLIAVVFSVISDIWWRAGEVDKAAKYSRVTLVLCILGIITTVTLWSTLLATNALPFIKHLDEGEGGHQFSD